MGELCFDEAVRTAPRSSAALIRYARTSEGFELRSIPPARSVGCDLVKPMGKAFGPRTRRGFAWRNFAVVAALVVLPAGVLHANELSATLELDHGSYISYGEFEKVRIRPGSQIRFRFGPPGSDGSIPLTIFPSDVSIAPIPVAQGSAIEYSLADVAVGTLRAGSAGFEIEVLATLVATLRGRTDVPSSTVALRFSTHHVEPSSADELDAYAADGDPVGALQAVRLVGTTTNPSDAFPGPGARVRAVLSGRFDRLPWAE